MQKLNEKRKASIARAIAARDYLKQEFPHAFRKGSRKQPLSLTIFHELMMHVKRNGNCTFTDAELYQGLRFYQNSTEYLHSHWPGVKRIDLFGNPSAIVTTAEAIAAQRLVALRWPRKRKTLTVKTSMPKQYLYKNMLLQKNKALESRSLFPS